jgi:serine/threonine protein kinase
MTERTILCKLSHPFIVHLHSTFQTGQKLYFVLDYCSGGELFNLLTKRKSITENQARFYAGQLVLALEYLHANAVVYRD